MINYLYDALRWQDALTLNDFSNTAYNSTYVSDVQSFITKVLCNNFSANIF